MRWTRWIAGGVVLAAAAVGLAWIDVLPGGWTLRGWVTPHAVRRARAQAEFSAERVTRFAETNATLAAGSIVFIGSSTIERFPLAELFPHKPCVDRGIGGETATELLARLGASLPHATPAGVVLYAASLDFRRENQPPAVVARRVAAIAEALHGRFAGVPVAVIGILPERDMPAAMVARLTSTNAELAALAEELGIAFVPTDRAPITDATGSLAADCAADRLHLGPKGYAALARWLIDEGGPVGELLGPE
ncbi:MAG: hypothetical protein GY711_21185 [bacterium]|nr:hypothetical protein [bacterium]